MERQFVLAQRGRKIEFASVYVTEGELKLGDSFERMPGSEKETWVVAKIFQPDEQRHLEALGTFIGMNKVGKFFETQTRF